MQNNFTSQEFTNPFNSYGLNGLNPDEIDVLVKLGLTIRQVRVYLALLKIDKGKAKAIADVSLVNRQEIYRILDDLQQMGLVQKHVSVPTTFTATPIEDVIKILLTHKTAELTKIRQKTAQITKKLQSNARINTENNEYFCVGTLFEADRGKKYCQAVSTARQCIDTIVGWTHFKQVINLFETQLQTALNNGVNLRIITEKPVNQRLPDWVLKAQLLNKKSNLELKTICSRPVAMVSIFDQTTAIISFQPTVSVNQGTDLWTTNQVLIALTRAYFDNNWMQIISKKI